MPSDRRKPKVDGIGSLAASQRLERRRNRGNAGSADWSTVDAALVLAVIVAAGKCGCKLTFGYGGELGSYAVGVLGDDEPYTDYIRPSESIVHHLEYLLQYFTDNWQDLLLENRERRENYRRT